MIADDRISVRLVRTQSYRTQAIEVLRQTYVREKGWLEDPASQIPESDLGRTDVCWFLALEHYRPVGVLRLLCNPPLAQYASYGIEPLDCGIRLEDVVAQKSIAEVGRFAVVPGHRSRITVVAALIRAATREAVSRGLAYIVTDVFEDDPHSPYGFHTRVMGFRPIATHAIGELRCTSRRITLLLDIKAAYRRLKSRGCWLYRYLTADWEVNLHRQLAG
jgi:hypothetical protein